MSQLFAQASKGCAEQVDFIRKAGRNAALQIKQEWLESLSVSAVVLWK